MIIMNNRSKLRKMRLVQATASWPPPLFISSCTNLLQIAHFARFRRLSSGRRRRKLPSFTSTSSSSSASSSHNLSLLLFSLPILFISAFKNRRKPCSTSVITTSSNSSSASGASSIITVFPVIIACLIAQALQWSLSPFSQSQSQPQQPQQSSRKAQSTTSSLISVNFSANNFNSSSGSFSHQIVSLLTVSLLLSLLRFGDATSSPTNSVSLLLLLSPTSAAVNRSITSASSLAGSIHHTHQGSVDRVVTEKSEIQFDKKVISARSVSANRDNNDYDRDINTTSATSFSPSLPNDLINANISIISNDSSAIVLHELVGNLSLLARDIDSSQFPASGNGKLFRSPSIDDPQNGRSSLKRLKAANRSSTEYAWWPSAARSPTVSSGRGNYGDYRSTTILLEPDFRIHHPTLAVLLALICVVVVFGNMLTMFAIYKERYLHTVTNYFVASLAAADCLVGAIVMPFSVVHEVMNKWWIFGPDWCDLWHSFDVLASTSSILNLCVISLDRYWAITDPITYPSRMTPSRACLFIFGLWLCSSLISFPAILWWRAVQKEPISPYRCIFTDDVGYLVFSSTISFYGPLTVMVFTYYRIYVIANEQTRALKLGVKQVETSMLTGGGTGGGGGSRNSVDYHANSGFALRMHRGGYQINNVVCGGAGSGCNGSASRASSVAHPHNQSIPLERCSQSSCDTCRQSRNSNHNLHLHHHHHQHHHHQHHHKNNLTMGRRLAKLAKERKAAKTLGIVMGVFILCWLPFFVTNILMGVCPETCIVEPDLVFSVVTWLGWINSAMNPVIYACWSRDFRRAFRKLLCSCFISNAALSYNRNRIYKAPVQSSSSVCHPREHHHRASESANSTAYTLSQSVKTTGGAGGAEGPGAAGAAGDRQVDGDVCELTALSAYRCCANSSASNNDNNNNQRLAKCASQTTSTTTATATTAMTASASSSRLSSVKGQHRQQQQPQQQPKQPQQQQTTSAVARRVSIQFADDVDRKIDDDVDDDDNDDDDHHHDVIIQPGELQNEIMPELIAVMNATLRQRLFSSPQRGNHCNAQTVPLSGFDRSTPICDIVKTAAATEEDDEEDHHLNDAGQDVRPFHLNNNFCNNNNNNNTNSINVVNVNNNNNNNNVKSNTNIDNSSSSSSSSSDCKNVINNNRSSNSANSNRGGSSNSRSSDRGEIDVTMSSSSLTHQRKKPS